jgi:hypothetical protein
MGFLLTIEPGDHLAAIAAEHGFSDPQTLWQAPENAELRQRRRNPSLLAPGDQLFVPDKQAKKVTVATGATHKFQLKDASVRLRIKLRDPLDHPIANATCEVELDGAATTAQLDGDGLLDVEMPARTQVAVLRVGEVEWELHVGQLDPVEQRAGLLARLRNLGYLGGEDPDVGPSDADLAFAVTLFQRDHGLAIDPSALDQVRSKLEEIHGC